MIRKWSMVGPAVALSALMGAAALADTPAETIAARRAGYKHIDAIAKSLYDAGSPADVAPFAPKVAEISAWLQKIPTLFPPGTDVGDTKAKPEVWSDPEGFKTAQQRAVAQVTKLQQVVAANDTADFAAQVKALATACSACHRQFRSR